MAASSLFGCGWEQWLGPGSSKRDQRDGQHLKNRGLGPVDLTAHFIEEKAEALGKEVFVQDLTMNEPEPDPERVFFFPSCCLPGPPLQNPC